MNKFKIFVLALFFVSLLLAVLIFGGFIPGFKGKMGGEKGATVTIWSSFDGILVRETLAELNGQNRNSFVLEHTTISEETYEERITNALASGRGPDMWVVSQDTILKNKDRVYWIPFEFFSERNFKDTYANSSEIFMNSSLGIMGFPIAIDPIVLYWNRDLFSNAGIASPPRYWDEFLSYSERLTKYDVSDNIMQSGAALGEFTNIENAKDILSMLILQSNNPIVKKDTQEVVMNKKGTNEIISPAENSVKFFNEFSDPGKTTYSWNRSLMPSTKMFVDGSLAMYFGYSGEIDNIRKRNPHLNFDVAVVPQMRDGDIRATFGKVYSVVISKFSPNKQASFLAATALTGEDFGGEFSEDISFASARRDVLSRGHEDPYFSIFYKSSIMSRSWLEPDPDQVKGVFREMVESVLTGRSSLSRAVQKATTHLQSLFAEI